MTWTYSVDQLNQPLYALRRMIGDVTSTAPLMQDEEILYMVNSNGSLLAAAAACCLSLASQFSVSVDQQAGGQKTSFSQMAKAFATRAVYFQTLATATGVGVGNLGSLGGIAGGIAGDLSETDPDTVFKVGMFDNLYPVAPVGIEAAPHHDDDSSGE